MTAAEAAVLPLKDKAVAMSGAFAHTHWTMVGLPWPPSICAERRWQEGCSRCDYLLTFTQCLSHCKAFCASLLKRQHTALLMI